MLDFVKVENNELIDAVESLAGAIWREHYPPIIGEAQVEYMLDKFQSARAISTQIQEGYIYYLISDELNRHIGYLCVCVEGEELFLSKIYLLKEVRGKGFGRQAMELIDGLARDNNCSKIWLTVNKKNSGSIDIYQKCGFAIARPVVRDIGQGFVMDDFKLEKSL